MKCVIYGCGAIGKAVAGVSMCGIGAEVTFVEPRRRIVEDVRRRGGYCVYEDEHSFQKVTGVRIVPADSEAAEHATYDADCIITCVGPNALRSVAQSIAQSIKRRNRKLLILLYENDAECAHVFANAFRAIPEWLHIEKASIERMSREYEHDGCVDVLSEMWIPVILNRGATNAMPELDNPAYFRPVDDMQRYYYRKLYTNNLGHAAIGYLGLQKGYRTCCEAIRDPEIRSITEKALEESARMLEKTLGFSEAEMRAHIEDLLIRRYTNEGLSDDLNRLARDPARKLEPQERIIGAARRCLECGVEPNGICVVADAALNKLDGDRERALLDICRLDRSEALFQRLLK